MFQKFKLPLAPAFLLALAFVFADASLAANSPEQDSYPPQQVETPPVEEVVTPTLALPYPANAQDFPDTVPAPVGDQVLDNESGLTGTPAEQAQESGQSGLVYLWVGFIATVVVLLISVFGSIMLFTRRNES
jgi:hypothetical protein